MDGTTPGRIHFTHHRILCFMCLLPALKITILIHRTHGKQMGWSKHAPYTRLSAVFENCPIACASCRRKSFNICVSKMSTKRLRIPPDSPPWVEATEGGVIGMLWPNKTFSCFVLLSSSTYALRLSVMFLLLVFDVVQTTFS